MPKQRITDSKRNSGFTLIEMIIVLALLGLVTSFLFTFVNFSTASEKKVEEEYELQADVRLTSEILNNAIRNSSVTFAVPGTVFENRKEKWNYFGIENKNTIVQYTYNYDTDEHDRSVLVEARDGIEYNLYFVQNTPGSKLIEYHLDVVQTDGDRKVFSVNSEVSALNSLVVHDGGDPGNPATAVAYRSESAPRPEQQGRKVTINVSLILDYSGSMGDDMYGIAPGKTGHDENNIRIDIMKKEARKLIDQFANLGIKVGIVPFSSTANNPHYIRDAKTYKVELKKIINGLEADGGTNTGDSMRRAYYQLKSSQPVTGEVVNYIILLTDGDPTFRTGTKSVRQGPYIARTDDGNTNYDTANGRNNNNNYVWGDGNNPDTNAGRTNLNNCMAYAETIGSMIVSDRSLDIGTFVIGFSAVKKDVGNNQKIAEDYCNGTYYEADSDIALENAFDEITKAILRETWHIYGPY